MKPGINETIQFDLLNGSCAICDGPVYFSRVIDWEGNRVNTIHCWNGHYESIEIDHYQAHGNGKLTTEQIERIIPFMSFVRLNGASDKD